MTGISTLGQALAQSERLKSMQTQLSQLTVQLTTGKKAQMHKDLGTQLMTTQRTRASLKDIETYKTNIDTADRRLKMMATSVGEMKRQAQIILGVLQAETQEGDFDLQAAGDLAAKARDFINNLINEKDGDRYLFGGSDALTPPLQDTALLDSYLTTKITEWTDGTISSAGLIESYRDTDLLTDTTAGFSAEIASGNVRKVSARLDNHKEIQYGALANDSGMRDIMVVAGMLENLAQSLDSVVTDPEAGSGQVNAPGADRETQNDNFYAVYDDMVKLLNIGINRLEAIEFDLSQSQIELKQAEDEHTLDKEVLLERLGSIEEVDLNEVAVKLNALQVQIEASYRMTAAIRDLNLTNFLPI